MDFFSRSRYYDKNYGYPSTSDEGYFFSGTVDTYEFYPVEITIPENLSRSSSPALKAACSASCESNTLAGASMMWRSSGMEDVLITLSGYTTRRIISDAMGSRLR